MNASLIAPEVAVLRSAAVLASAGVPATDRLVVVHALGARGIGINSTNAARYARHLGALIGAGLIEYDAEEPGLDGAQPVIITGKGRATLDEIDGRRS